MHKPIFKQFHPVSIECIATENCGLTDRQTDRVFAFIYILAKYPVFDPATDSSL